MCGWSALRVSAVQPSGREHVHCVIATRLRALMTVVVGSSALQHQACRSAVADDLHDQCVRYLAVSGQPLKARSKDTLAHTLGPLLPAGDSALTPLLKRMHSRCRSRNPRLACTRALPPKPLRLGCKGLAELGGPLRRTPACGRDSVSNGRAWHHPAWSNRLCSLCSA